MGEARQRAIPPDRPNTAESEWLAWLDAARPPVLAPGLDSDARLVVVAPHPDDEVLGCGGLLAEHAAAGGRAAVIAVTDGEASHAGDPGWAPDRLAATRRGESAAGLGRLGLPSDVVTRLQLPDGQLTQHRVALRTALRGLLQPGDVVVSTWRFDGHPDHEATGASAAEACGELGCRFLEVPVWMWHWSAPGDARVPWSRLRSFALTGASRDAKRQALDAHRSQLEPRYQAGPVLDPPIVARAARHQEYFLV